MPKKIVIETCESCPKRDHMGAFGQVAYIPCCCAMQLKLPYNEVSRNGRPYAEATHEIPDWCPLEDD